MEQKNVVELDVRPLLREKKEPFQVIMETVSQLKPEDTFILHAIFNPVPLLGVMKSKGYDSKVEQLEEDHFVITFTKAG
ncbi:DUF2249 domain-containing protein [Microaerobacter geothermalis]|uniref:DUF2249 domain-containing protein n=1 Tax=Microaerobacter geothermalis TaxID=674972 RepID=UPI001F334FD2|nr:DUF2249 domain-containing protein [Microaerobacter geothermalis]MCF6092447.1 DUF2249 domain-containing protein [Microaerobacter geothermalis]